MQTIKERLAIMETKLEQMNKQIGTLIKVIIISTGSVLGTCVLPEAWPPIVGFLYGF